jgi:predicted NAD-dependent protein-ADP-ribosyltransferase YbiA (DUF1768 family)
MNLNDVGLNPSVTKSVNIDGVDWRTPLNYIYASLIDGDLRRKFRSMEPNVLRTNVNEVLRDKMYRTIKKAIYVATEEKFKDHQLSQLLLQTGRVNLNADSSLNQDSLESEIIMNMRKKLRKNAIAKVKDRDKDVYLRRIKQSHRIYQAMKKIMFEGDSLARFKHFSVSSIPNELNQLTNDVVSDFPPEIKSAALSMDGNILYRFLRREHIREYSIYLPSLRMKIAKSVLSAHILDTKFPHFLDEAISKKTKGINNKINRLRLSLENHNLPTQLRRERENALSDCNQQLRLERNCLTKKKLYRNHAKLLDVIPECDEKVWDMYKKKTLPISVMNIISEKINRLYCPSDTEIEQAEAWKHECQTFSPDDDDLDDDHSLSCHYNLAVDFPELQSDYAIQLQINGNTYTSVSHYALFSMVRDILEVDNRTIKSNPNDYLTGITGKFVGISNAKTNYETLEKEIYIAALTKSCEVALSTWVERSQIIKKKLLDTKGKLFFNDDNVILGKQLNGGFNMIGKTMERIRALI